MNQNMPPKGFMKENSQSPFVNSIKDGILYMATLMAVITLANHYSLGVYIQDAKLVFKDYIIFGIGVCIVHLISDKISVYLTSSIIMNAVKDKKQIPGRVFLIPWIIEVLFDFWLVTLFGFLSVYVMFEDITITFMLTIVIRLINGLIESIFKSFTRRGEENDKGNN